MRTPNNLLRRRLRRLRFTHTTFLPDSVNVDSSWRHIIYCAEGFTSALDFAVEGVVCDYTHPLSFGSEKTDQRTDAQSLSGDWIAVGQYIQTAIGKVEQELSGGVAAKQ